VLDWLKDDWWRLWLGLKVAEMLDPARRNMEGSFASGSMRPSSIELALREVADLRREKRKSMTTAAITANAPNPPPMPAPSFLPSELPDEDEPGLVPLTAA